MKSAQPITNASGKHAISAMAMEIDFQPKLHQVKMENRAEGACFVESGWGYENQDARSRRSTASERRDAFEVRDEFLAVADQRGALNFLRDTGKFLRYQSEVLWSDFQRWQTLASIMMRPRDLATVYQRLQDGEALDDLGTEGEDIENAVRMFTGDRKFAKGTRTNIFFPEVPLADGESVKKLAGREVEADAFIKAPNFKLQIADRNNEMPEFLRQINVQDQLCPILITSPSCTIEAVANAIWIERMANVSYGQCKECKRLFRLSGHKNKVFCDDETCKWRYKKREKRLSAKEKEALENAFPGEPPFRA